MRTTSCIIIDRDRNYTELLTQQLKHCFHYLDVVAQATNCIEAEYKINTYHPDIMVLNMAVLPDNPLPALENMQQHKCVAIAIAENDTYALRAIKANMVDYLLKPAGDNELKTAFSKAMKVLCLLNSTGRQAEPAEDKIQTATDDKLPVRVGNFYELVSTHEIVFCKAYNNYTEIVLNDKRKFLLSKTLKFFETRFQQQNFCRIHQSFLVNPRFIKSVEKGRYSQLVLKDGTSLDIAQARKEKVFTFLGV